jgi:hypothetical protein
MRPFALEITVSDFALAAVEERPAQPSKWQLPSLTQLAEFAGAPNERLRAFPLRGPALSANRRRCGQRYCGGHSAEEGCAAALSGGAEVGFASPQIGRLQLSCNLPCLQWLRRLN